MRKAHWWRRSRGWKRKWGKVKDDVNAGMAKLEGYKKRPWDFAIEFSDMGLNG